MRDEQKQTPQDVCGEARPCHEHIAVESTSILAIGSNREQETVSMLKCSLK